MGCPLRTPERILPAPEASRCPNSREPGAAHLRVGQGTCLHLQLWLRAFYKGNSSALSVVVVLQQVSVLLIL